MLSEMKARSCDLKEILVNKLYPGTLYWQETDWERHWERKRQPLLQRKIMNLINLAFSKKKKLLSNPESESIIRHMKMTYQTKNPSKTQNPLDVYTVSSRTIFPALTVAV